MTHILTVSNQQGATIRESANKGGAEIRRVADGTRLEYLYELDPLPNGDRWAVIAPIDPKTKQVWRSRTTNQEVAAYVAVYVGGTPYADVARLPPILQQPAPPQGGSSFDDGVKFGRNQVVGEIKDFLDTL